MRHFEEPSDRRKDYARKGRGLRNNMTSDLFSAAAVAVSATGEGDMGLLIFYITLALGVSFMCSILEAVVLSTPQTSSTFSKTKESTADMWAHLKDDDSVRPLTAILTLNTIARPWEQPVLAASATNLGRCFYGCRYFDPRRAVPL